MSDFAIATQRLARAPATASNAIPKGSSPPGLGKLITTYGPGRNRHDGPVLELGLNGDRRKDTWMRKMRVDPDLVNIEGCVVNPRQRQAIRDDWVSKLLVRIHDRSANL